MSVSPRHVLVAATSALALSGGLAVPASAHRLTQSRAESVARDIARIGAESFDRDIAISCERGTVHRVRCIARYSQDGEFACDSYIRVAYRTSTSYRFNTREYDFEGLRGDFECYR